MAAPTPSPEVDRVPSQPWGWSQIDASSVVPTSLMKYVLFLSAHLDRPVSSLEQNGKTGRTVQHWTWQSVQRQCRVKGGRFITVPVHLSTREQCNTPSAPPPDTQTVLQLTSASTAWMGTQLGIKKWTTANSSSVVTALPKYWKYRRGNKYPSIQTTIKSSVNKTAFLL